MGRKVTRLNNEGMTLVELLVALVILAAIVVPLLHTFISAANVNQKARQRLKVTTVAQDIMEGIKADRLEDLSYQFNYPTGPVLNERFRLLSMNMIQNGASGIHEVECTVNADGSIDDFEYITPGNESVSVNAVGTGYELSPRASGKYYFALEDVKVDPSDNSYKTDVIISVDATNYRDASPTPAADKLNSTKLVDINDMSPINNAICAEPATLAAAAADSINLLNAGATSYTKDDLAKTITVKVDDIPSTPGAVKVDVEIKYTVGSDVYTESYPCFENSTSPENKLEGLYLFYYPNYNHATTAKDVITIDNNKNIDFTMYIVKLQEKANEALGITDADLSLKEANYRCDVKISENETNIINKHIKIRTNLDYNLYDMYNFANTINVMSPLQAAYTYKGASISRDNLKIESLGGEKTSDRLYDVTVYLYKEGSIANAMAGSGSIPSENKLYELEGSIK